MRASAAAATARRRCLRLPCSLRAHRYVALVANAVLLHWLLFGVAAASLGRALANAHMLVRRAHSVEQRVEWLYAFDIHCNAYFMVSSWYAFSILQV
jgi:UNC-50 family